MENARLVRIWDGNKFYLVNVVLCIVGAIAWVLTKNIDELLYTILVIGVMNVLLIVLACLRQ